MRIAIIIAATLLATAASAHEAPKGTTTTAQPASAGTPATPTQGQSAHSGGTDAYGCHTNSQTGDYHCHRPK